MTSEIEAGHLALRFLANEAEETEGLGHAGIETYRDDPFAATARETGQNSNDAVAAAPVRMRFDVIEIPTTDIPDVDGFRTAVTACLSQAEARQDEKEIEFFFNAKDVIDASEIRVLRISDFNTKGLKGPPQPGSPFHALLKGAGVSNKDVGDSGGSFGIGKNAPYAASDLQTVFYSTVYKDESSGSHVFLAQGRTVLVSHTDSSGTPRRATGYWGANGFDPVSDPEDVPAWLRRVESGLSVYSIGFRRAEDWQYRITYSLLINFFAAIHAERMEFHVDDGSIVLNRGTLGAMFDNTDVVSAAEENDRREELDLARSLYECLVSEEAEQRQVHVDGLGTVSIRVLVREGLPKRVCILRNGMVITHTLENFGERLLRFPMYRDFVAVVEPLDFEGRVLIKRLENPRHDGLSAERISVEVKREAARRAMRKLGKEIRGTIREFTVVSHTGEVTLDELAKYFSGPESEATDSPPSMEDDPEAFVYQPTRTRRRRRPVGTASEGDSGSEGPGGGKRSGGRRGTGSGGPGQTGSRRHIELRNFRNTFADNSDLSRRRLLFTPAESGLTLVTLEAVGLNDNETLAIRSAEGADVVGARISVQLNAGERAELTVEFEEPYGGPLELQAVQEDREEATD